MFRHLLCLWRSHIYQGNICFTILHYTIESVDLPVDPYWHWPVVFDWLVQCIVWEAAPVACMTLRNVLANLANTAPCRSIGVASKS